MVDRYRQFRKICGKPPVSAGRIRRTRQLYPAEKPEELLRRVDGQKLSGLTAVFLTGSLLCLALLCSGEEQQKVSALERPDYGEKESTYELEVEREDGSRLPMEVTVPEMVLTREEAEERFEKAYEEVCMEMLGENESLLHVERDLTLPQKALNGLVSVEWTSRSREIFNDWGELQKRPGERPEEGETGSYELSLSCSGYSCQYELELRVYPPKQTAQEAFLETMELVFEKGGEERGQREIALPKNYEGEQLIWFLREEGGVGSWILWLPPVVCLLMAARGFSGEKESLKKREREMLMDYPELVSKFTVLLQAGLTARNVWERMVKEYEERKKSGKKPRYAYEEMSITNNQMKNGMYESQAYGEFGRRCSLHTYMKFGALLEQNLRQGTTGLTLRLKEEAELAFEERKNLARRLGEEAETKLMLPMFLMLFVVLTVIMAPAFLSF